VSVAVGGAVGNIGDGGKVIVAGTAIGRGACTATVGADWLEGGSVAQPAHNINPKINR